MTPTAANNQRVQKILSAAQALTVPTREGASSESGSRQDLISSSSRVPLLKTAAKPTVPSEENEPARPEDNEPAPPEDNEPTTAVEWEVEAILDHRRRVDGTVEYLVKWKGYGDSAASWVADTDLPNAGMIVQEYENAMSDSVASDSFTGGVFEDDDHDEHCDDETAAEETEEGKEDTEGEGGSRIVQHHHVHTHHHHHHHRHPDDWQLAASGSSRLVSTPSSLPPARQALAASGSSRLESTPLSVPPARQAHRHRTATASSPMAMRVSGESSPGGRRRPPRSRKIWTEAESNCLLAIVVSCARGEECDDSGCADWCKVSSVMGRSGYSRSNVACKDRVRHLLKTKDRHALLLLPRSVQETYRRR